MKFRIIVLTLLGLSMYSQANSIAQCKAFYVLKITTAAKPTADLKWDQLLPTKSVTKFVGHDLLKAIQIEEKKGMKGGWYQSISPFSVDGKLDYFYVLKTTPVEEDLNSPVFLFKTKHALEFLNQRLDEGVQVIFGPIPLQAGVLAAALGSIQLQTDLATKMGSNHSNLVLLQPTADKYVFAHEIQHWRDFESASYSESFGKDLGEFLKAKYLDDDDKYWLWRITWEIRGHSAQEIQIKSDQADRLQLLNRVGDPITKQKEITSTYEFEAADATSAFMQTYPTTLWKIAAKIKKQGPLVFSRFVKGLEKYDMHDNPKASLSFHALLAK